MSKQEFEAKELEAKELEAVQGGYRLGPELPPVSLDGDVRPTDKSRAIAQAEGELHDGGALQP